MPLAQDILKGLIEELKTLAKTETIVGSPFFGGRVYGHPNLPGFARCRRGRRNRWGRQEGSVGGRWRRRRRHPNPACGPGGRSRSRAHRSYTGPWGGIHAHRGEDAGLGRKESG